MLPPSSLAYIGSNRSGTRAHKLSDVLMMNWQPRVLQTLFRCHADCCCWMAPAQNTQVLKWRCPIVERRGLMLKVVVSAQKTRS